ncbi:hypothetical protein HKD37_01G000881 [Glycine soja]
MSEQAFCKVYGKILDLAAAEVFTEAVVSLAQYYDQPLRCFTFGDFQMVPTIEEFEEILGCPLGGRKPYLFSGFLPSLSKIAAVIGDSAKELDRMKQTRNGIVGLPRKYLEGKARDMASQEKWSPKESPVVAILADLFDTFDRRCEKNGARIVCCLPALCMWLISHLFRQDTRHPCPLQSYRSCAEKGGVDWDQHLAGIGGSAISWFPRWKEGKEGVLFLGGDYPNVPLIGTRGCINYNPALAIRQLGYPMRGAPTEESLSPFLVRNLGAQNLKVIQRIHKAWRSPLKKNKELRGIRNGVTGGYHGWLRIHAQGLDWLSKLKVIDEENFEAPEEDEEVRALKLELGKARLAKEKFKSAATHIRKGCTELQEENAATARALEQETKRARKEEYGREKFRGALWGSNNELKLRREERDRSRVHGLILKEELVACARSKRSLAQHLEATERSMLAIIGQYKEELNQSVAHEQKLVEDFAQVYAEKEARGRVIDALHQEATMWMDRFALTLNGSQDLPRLLAKAKAMAEVCTSPEEIHGLINYCQHMIDLMAHIIRNQRAPTQRTAPAAPRPVNNTAPGATYKYAQHPPPKDNFPPIPMAYSELWPSLLENHLVVAIPGKVLQPPYPKWYDPGAKCVYHSGIPGHNIDSCIPFKYKVQHLISADWLSFQEEGRNVKTNPLASHGGASVNAVEEDGLSRAKRLGEVATSRRFIYQSLQAACMVSRGGDERDECLFHLGESHDIETCPRVEELLQRLMDCRQLEVSIEGREEPQICMQSEEKKVPFTPKALVICFTRKGTGSTPIYPRTAPKPTPFAYQSNKAVPWKYTPPASSERVATEVDSLSAKVTNITGLSGVTRSGRVFASPHPTKLPSKGKAPMVQEPIYIATPSKEVDPPVGRGAKKKEACRPRIFFINGFLCFLEDEWQQNEERKRERRRHFKEKMNLEEAHHHRRPWIRAWRKKEMNEGRGREEHEILNGFEPGMGLGKDCLGNVDVVNIKGNPYKYGLGYEPGMPGRRNVPSRFRVDRVWPGRISQCFTSAGMVSEEEVAAIEEEFPHDPPSFVQPCHPDSQVGNWRVISQSEVYTADSIVLIYIYCLLSKTGPDGRRETRGTGTREMTRKPRQDFSVSKPKEILKLSLSLTQPSSSFLPPPLLPNKASTFGAHLCSKSRKEGIFGVVKCVSTSGTSKFQLGRIDGDPVLRETRIWATWEYVSSVGGGQQGMSGTWRYVAGVRRPWGRQIVMAAQLIHDRVEMECLEGAWETLEGNTRCRFRGTIRFTATSLVHPDEPARTLQRTVEWILPTPTPYRLVEPVQVIEVTSSEEDPEEDLEELPPKPAVDALDFLEGDEDPLLEVNSPEEVMSASEADSTEDSGPGEMAISGGSSS